jgi:hypothetical protein
MSQAKGWGLTGLSSDIFLYFMGMQGASLSGKIDQNLFGHYRN